MQAEAKNIQICAATPSMMSHIGQKSKGCQGYDVIPDSRSTQPGNHWFSGTDRVIITLGFAWAAVSLGYSQLR